MLFAELKETGIDYNGADSLRFKQYTRGYSAIDRLFRASPTQVSGGWGDVMVRGGIVQTQSGGNISIMAPYGTVTVGYHSEDAKNYGQGGIITRRGGDVRIMADDSIDFYVSRVFTLQGGDLTMWTSNGNISAGAGAKTSVFNIPLQFTMDNDGRVSVDAFGLSTGAGIGVLDALQASGDAAAKQPTWNPPAGTSGGPQQDRPVRKKSRMDLLAFRGEINAGDAGIRVVGDFNIAALSILNAANITVSGATTGLPTVLAPNIAGLTEASNVAGSAAQTATLPTASRDGDRPSIIIVEFLGFGGGDGGPENEEQPGRKNRQSYDTNSVFQVVGNGTLTPEQAQALTDEEKRNSAR
ncbi:MULTISPECIES: filamentous hemagglutinin family protein [unclassified Bradyrhizobium]